jgi:hypothetical protein
MSSRALFYRRSRLAGFVLGLFMAAGNDATLRATSALASFTGTVTTPPVVDATNFNNSATWNITTGSGLYRTAGTLNYYNNASMSGSPGWDFAWYPSGSGVTHPSATFTNGNLGVISAGSSTNSFFYGYPGQLLVRATNLVNKGLLSADGSGKVQLSGVNVSLARSKVEILPLVSTGGYNSKTNTFTGDIGVYDQVWGSSTNDFVPQFLYSINSVTTNDTVTALIESIQSSAPVVSGLTAPCGVYGNYQLIGYSNNNFVHLTNSLTDTNIITGYGDWTYSYDAKYSNFVVQVALVRVRDTNFTASIHFAPSSIGTNIAKTISVYLTASITNLVTLQSDLASLYIDDTVLSETNSGFNANLSQNLKAACTGTTFRPANYMLSRSDLGMYSFGNPGFGTPTNNIFTLSNFVRDVVLDKFPLANSTKVILTNGFGKPLSGEMNAYQAYVDNLSSEPPASANPSLTNFPGEIRIYATNLDLNLARIRAEGELLIQANNLTTNPPFSVDCQNLSYNLGATNGFLHFQNLAKTNVYRLNGAISLQDVVWNDTVTVPGGADTNSYPVAFHYLIVDASELSAQLPVSVYDLQLHATNIVVSDQMVIRQNLLLDGKSFTLDSLGNMSFGSGIPTWNYTFMPTLSYFTNNGSIAVNGNAHFGDDGPTNLLAFVNTGTLTSSGQFIKADYMELDGVNFAGSLGEFDAYCKTGIVNGAGIYDGVYAGANLQFFANNLTISNGTTLYAGGALNFFITNILTDAGIGDFNYLQCGDGFNLPIKPAAGDLLGTTIESDIVGGAQVDHVWAGHDYGRNVVGYLNNAAVGYLYLNAADLTQFPLFNFVGAGSQNALYVDVLDLSSLGADFVNYLQIADNFKIYYNQAIGDASLTTGGAASPGLLNGHLIWMGSTNATTNIVFGASSQPISPAGFKLSANGVFFPSGLAASNIIVLSSTNLLLPLTNWTPIYTGTPPFTFTDTAISNRPAKFYRAKQGW